MPGWNRALSAICTIDLVGRGCTPSAPAAMLGPRTLRMWSSCEACAGSAAAAAAAGPAPCGSRPGSRRLETEKGRGHGLGAAAEREPQSDEGREKGEADEARCGPQGDPHTRRLARQGLAFPARRQRPVIVWVALAADVRGDPGGGPAESPGRRATSCARPESRAPGRHGTIRAGKNEPWDPPGRDRARREISGRRRFPRRSGSAGRTAASRRGRRGAGWRGPRRRSRTE